MTTWTTDIAKTPHCPILQPGASRLAIAVPSTADLVLHGSFQLSPRDAEELGASPHRKLVVVVTCGHLQSVTTPFRERVLFEDDVQTSPAGVRGYFTVDLLASVGERVPGTWFILVSLGVHVSTVIAVGSQRRTANP